MECMREWSTLTGEECKGMDWSESMEGVAVKASVYRDISCVAYPAILVHNYSRSISSLLPPISPLHIAYRHHR